jgi:hypothetical protein
MTENVFGHNIYVSTVKVNATFTKYRTIFTNQIINVSNYLPLMAKREGRGNSRSTVSRPDTLNRMIGYAALIESLQPHLDEARSFLFPESDKDKFILIRGWANVMHTGSSIVSHIHKRIKNKHMLCIFYLEAPEDSAQFGVVNSEQEGLEANEYDPSQVHFIAARTNQLICHVNNVNHVVSKHLAKERRVAVILEMALVDENSPMFIEEV